MNVNPMLLYKKNRHAIRDFNRTAQPPAVMNNKLEALKVLANSILFEVASLEKNREIATQTMVDLAGQVQRFEVDLIRCALTRTGGRQRRAASLLGIKPTTLHAKMKRYGMTHADMIAENENDDDTDTD
jgi:DNA-binding NtrC family response regulator